MLKIFLNGETGKMGSCISSLIDKDDSLELVNQDFLKNADVVIDYSHPDSTASILQECIRLHKPMVIGTTGIKKDLANQIIESSKTIPIMQAANTSKGIMNLKESILQFISNNTHHVECHIKEIHHKEKIDSPSGTAIELKEFIRNNDKNNIVKSINITSIREDDVFGIHEITFNFENNFVEFKHEALSREAFAIGAISAAKFMSISKPDIYKFSDIF